MKFDLLSSTTELIKKRIIEKQNKLAESDKLAWAIMALNSTGSYSDVVAALRARLMEFQTGDGRFTLIKGASHVFWPTPLILLALVNISDFKEEKEKAVSFLLNKSGLHWTRGTNDPIEHDTSIKGWPWIDGTHSWVVPTANVILALRAYGFSKHDRVLTGIKMILNRQLSAGGWNYGNTVVFGSTLKPMPECTGIVLNAIHGLVEREKIAKSLTYCIDQSRSVRTPLSLSWTLMGLGTWSQRPRDAKKWVIETLNKQEWLGEYPVSLLSQLVLSYHAEKGLLDLLEGDKADG